MLDKVFIDSNIFLYAFCDKDTAKQTIARSIVLENATISTQVSNEVSVNMLRKLKFNECDIVFFVKSSFSRYAVVNLSSGIFTTASRVREKYSISYYDSIVVASAVENKCTILYSEDMQHDQVIEQNLKIVNPFK